LTTPEKKRKKKRKKKEKKKGFQLATILRRRIFTHTICETCGFHPG
jgi:ribosomal protein L32